MAFLLGPAFHTHATIPVACSFPTGPWRGWFDSGALRGRIAGLDGGGMLKVEQLKEVLELVSAGVKQGYLTYDEINDALPPSVNDKESIDAVLAFLARNNIRIIDFVQ